MIGRELHISSLVLQVAPHEILRLGQNLSKINNIEVALSDEHLGKIVVVLESDSTEGISTLIKKVESLPPVITAHMAFHHCERRAS